MQKFILIFTAILFCSGCQKNYISIVQTSIDKNYLASTALDTPDPRQKNPPIGEKLIVEWKVPKEYLSSHPSLHLHVIYKDYTEAFFTYPVSYTMDYVVYSLLNEEYFNKKGILTYLAEIKAKEEKPFLLWKHQLWTHLIALEDDQIKEQSEEESFSSTSEINSSVSDQPRQGSVSERDEFIEEELKD